MPRILSFLILLSTVQLGVSALVQRRIGGLEPRNSCGEGQYYSTETGFCNDCKVCDDFFYVEEECQETTDTVCKWCGHELNFAEAPEEVMGSYADSCLVGRMEYMHKMENIKNMESARKFGSDSEERAESNEDTNESGEFGNSESDEEMDRNERLQKNFLRELEDKVQREESERLHGEMCQEGQYYNYVEDMCFDCTVCGHFLYETSRCTKTSNTVCTWCGKEPNYESISDINLSLYQNKCMMAQLNFVDMNELFDDSDSDELNYDSEEDGDADEDEQDPTFDARVQIAMEKREEDELVKTLNLKSRPASAEEEEQSSEEQETNTEEDLDQSVSHTVDAYFIKKGRKINVELDRTPIEEVVRNDRIVKAQLTLPYDLSYDGDDLGLSHASGWFHHRPLHSKLPEPKEISGEEDSTEESNERIIRWDRWVDDEVKPIRKTETVQAEEIDLSVFEKDIVVRVDDEETGQENVFTIPIHLLVLIVFITCVAVSYFFIVCVQARARKTVFLGVPTDSQDYHMILDASRHIEKIEAKEKKASRHIHENPIFDI